MRQERACATWRSSYTCGCVMRVLRAIYQQTCIYISLSRIKFDIKWHHTRVAQVNMVVADTLVPYVIDVTNLYSMFLFINYTYQETDFCSKRPFASIIVYGHFNQWVNENNRVLPITKSHLFYMRQVMCQSISSVLSSRRIKRFVIEHFRLCANLFPRYCLQGALSILLSISGYVPIYFLGIVFKAH